MAGFFMLVVVVVDRVAVNVDALLLVVADDERFGVSVVFYVGDGFFS